METFQDVLARVEAAEQVEGWIAECDRAGVFLALNREFVSTLAEMLRCETSVLEICAGNGELALALEAFGVHVIATDEHPRSEHVLPLAAAEAIERFSPELVLACFPPIHAGIEAAVCNARCVKSFLYIGPEWDGQVGTDALWNRPEWSICPLPHLERFLVSRLDYCVDFNKATHRRRAGAIWLKRL